MRYPSLLLASLLSLAAAHPAAAQPTSSPVDALAQKLRDDPREREEAGRRLEAFLLNPDASGKRFVSADADRAALGAVAREWVRTAEPGRLAALIYTAAPASAGEVRLRAALAPWTGSNQIGKTSERTHVAAFMNDAVAKAGQTLANPRTRADIEAAIRANDEVVPAVPDTNRAVERAAAVRESDMLRSSSIFGADRAPEGTAAGAGASGGPGRAGQAGSGAGPGAAKVGAGLDRSAVPLPARPQAVVLSGESATMRWAEALFRVALMAPPPGTFNRLFGGAPATAAGKLAAAKPAPLVAAHAVTMTVSTGDLSGAREIWDKDGRLMARTTSTGLETYNRELQAMQRQMNQNRPAGAPFIPETGRYNYEMFEYSHARLKNLEREHVDAARIDRMIVMAELLGKQYASDQWFNDPSLEQDLVRQAKNKTYTKPDGSKLNVLDIVDAKFTQRRYYLDSTKAAVLRYETDMNRFKETHAITAAQVATMSVDEQNAMRWATLATLESQMHWTKQLSERVDPASPDAWKAMQLVDESPMTPEQKQRYVEQMRGIKARLDGVKSQLEAVRRTLNAAGAAASPGAVISTQVEIKAISEDYGRAIQSIPPKRSESVFARLARWVSPAR